MIKNKLDKLNQKLESMGLTPREVSVAELVATGLSNKEVGERLNIHEKTVKFHLTSVFKKLLVKSRGQLIIWSAPHMSPLLKQFFEDQRIPQLPA